MQQSYKIKKNNPLTYFPYKQQLTSTNNSTLVSPIDSTCPKILLKSIGDNWLQIYERQKLIDVIALPLMCKIDRLSFVGQVKGQGQGEQMGCLFWVQGQSQVGVGRLDQGSLGEVNMMFTDIGQCSFVTNAVSLCPGSIISMSRSSSGISHINIIQMDSQLKNEQITINQQLHQNSNITTVTHQCLNFISDPFSPTLNIYNLKHETLTCQFDLPQINNPTTLKTISTVESPLIYTYCQEWLAISDSRYNKLVAYQPLIGCRTATNVQQGGNILFSDGCFLSQYQVRRGQVNRMPKLVHSKPIFSVSIVGNGIMIQDDGMGLHFYQ